MSGEPRPYAIRLVRRSRMGRQPQIVRVSLDGRDEPVTMLAMGKRIGMLKSRVLLMASAALKFASMANTPLCRKPALLAAFRRRSLVPQSTHSGRRR